MVMPTIQNCPKCGDPFMGSDAIGDPCDRCKTEVRGIKITCPACDGSNNNCIVCGGDGSICGITKTKK